MGNADAIAVGGGLAGAAFALELARSGVKAVVLERSRAASLRVCGDFLSAEALDLLAYLGIAAPSLGSSPVDKLTLAAGRRSATAPLPFRAAGLSRLCLDEAVLAAAASAGAAIVRGVSATELKHETTAATVTTDRGAWHAPHVALATGKHNLRGWQRDAGDVSGFKIQVELSPAALTALTGRVHLTLFDGGYIGLCRVERGAATVCWQIDTEILKRTGSDIAEQWAVIARQSPEFGDLLSGAKPLTPKPAAISNLPFGYVRRAPTPAAIFPVGDQMAVIPAFTGDGTSIALASGIRAAHAVLAGEPAAEYQGKFAASLKRQFVLARAVNAALRGRATRGLAVGSVGMFPPLAALLARATRLTAVSKPVLARAL